MNLRIFFFFAKVSGLLVRVLHLFAKVSCLFAKVYRHMKIRIICCSVFRAVNFKIFLLIICLINDLNILHHTSQEFIMQH